MSGSIHVDKEALDAQTAKLTTLVNDETLKNYCAESIVPVLTQSAGEHVGLITTVNDELNEVVAQFYLLMGRTLDFLTNAGTAFIEADEGLAERIRAGEFITSG